MNKQIYDVMEVLLEGYVKFPEKIKKSFGRGKWKEISFHREWCVNDILIMIRDVENGFEGTYDEWLKLEYDKNLKPILRTKNDIP
jgi:hypothetical protein